MFVPDHSGATGLHPSHISRASTLSTLLRRSSMALPARISPFTKNETFQAQRRITSGLPVSHPRLRSPGISLPGVFAECVGDYALIETMVRCPDSRKIRVAQLKRASASLRRIAGRAFIRPSGPGSGASVGSPPVIAPPTESKGIEIGQSGSTVRTETKDLLDEMHKEPRYLFLGKWCKLL